MNVLKLELKVFNYWMKVLKFEFKVLKSGRKF